MIKVPYNSALARQASAALLCALATWATAYELSTSAIAQDCSRAALARKIASQRTHDFVLLSLHGFSAASSGLHVVVEESLPAEASSVATVPDAEPLITRCLAVGTFIAHDVVLPPTPDRLIELPGTPPPSLD